LVRLQNRSKFTANRALLLAENAALGTVVENAAVDELPLNGKSAACCFGEAAGLDNSVGSDSIPLEAGSFLQTFYLTVVL
jgi:hypothetical protein